MGHHDPAGKAHKMHRLAAVPLVPFIAIALMGEALPATSRAAQTTGPAVYVISPCQIACTWQYAPVAFVLKHAPAHTQYRMVARPWPINPQMGSRDVIKMGVHQTNASGKFRMHYEFRNHLAHFNGKVLEKWIVNAIQLHSQAGEPGPYSRIFSMARGCACGGGYLPASPGMYVEPPVTSQHAPVTFIVKNTDAYKRYLVYVNADIAGDIGKPETIKMGIHQTDAWGKFTVIRNFGHRFPHSHGKATEKWVAYAVLWPSRRTKFSRIFSMTH